MYSDTGGHVHIYGCHLGVVAGCMATSNTISAEWAPQKAMWVGFPSHADLWGDDLASAQAEVAALAKIIATVGTVPVQLMVMGEDSQARAEYLLGDIDNITIHQAKFGDIWIRDTGPIFTHAAAQRFQHNGWGGKYQLDHDDTVGDWIADQVGKPVKTHQFVLEGGALDHNGAGVCLTTRQCLLNPNRNPGMSATDYEAAFANAFGTRTTIWLDDGLVNDHTDGHVDNLARFVGPDTVAVPAASGDDDPNADIYTAAAQAVSAAGLNVVRVPSPGRIEQDGKVVPASHMNFLITNGAVIVPLYEQIHSAKALDVFKDLFPDHQVIGLPSGALLTGGGSFHCITQQEPA